MPLLGLEFRQDFSPADAEFVTMLNTLEIGFQATFPEVIEVSLGVGFLVEVSRDIYSLVTLNGSHRCYHLAESAGWCAEALLMRVDILSVLGFTVYAEFYSPKYVGRYSLINTISFCSYPQRNRIFFF